MFGVHEFVVIHGDDKMFNEKYKQAAIRDLEIANKQYAEMFKRTIGDMARLLQSRQRAVMTIRKIEGYVNGLANKPREYETKIGKISVRYLEFQNRIEKIQQLEENSQQVHYENGVGAGILVGVGGAALVPNAAMAVAMTFGTASTGTAIASLSGAAATNAALAWLGGGALAVGGAGIAGGEVLLAMAGPVGLAIGAASVTGGILHKVITNANIAKQAEEATTTIIIETKRIKEIDAVVNSWNKETIKLSNELIKKCTILRRKKDYSAFSEEEKKELAIVMNMTEVLSKKLEETIS